MWWLVLLLAQGGQVQAQAPPQDQAQRIRAAMEASIEQQRASVQKQIKALHEVPQVTPISVIPPPPRATVAPWDCEPIAQPELSRMIDSIARSQNVDPTLVREVARQESGFHPCAVSPKGAEGLMQLMPATQISLEVRNPFDAQESLTGGAKLLKQLLDRYNGDLKLALSAYNAGPTRVDQAAGVPQITETENYVSTILDRLRKQ